MFIWSFQWCFFPDKKNIILLDCRERLLLTLLVGPRRGWSTTNIIFVITLENNRMSIHRSKTYFEFSIVEVPKYKLKFSTTFYNHLPAHILLFLHRFIRACISCLVVVYLSICRKTAWKSDNLIRLYGCVVDSTPSGLRCSGTIAYYKNTPRLNLIWDLNSKLKTQFFEDK